MVDLRNTIAFAICEYDEEHPGSCGCGGVCSNTHAIGHADALLAALDAAGLVVVPRDASYAMQNAAIDVDSYKLGDISPLGFRCSPQKLFARCYAAMLAASPYAKKEA